MAGDGICSRRGIVAAEGRPDVRRPGVRPDDQQRQSLVPSAGVSSVLHPADPASSQPLIPANPPRRSAGRLPTPPILTPRTPRPTGRRSGCGPTPAAGRTVRGGFPTGAGGLPAAAQGCCRRARSAVMPQSHPDECAGSVMGLPAADQSGESARRGGDWHLALRGRSLQHVQPGITGRRCDQSGGADGRSDAPWNAGATRIAASPLSRDVGLPPPICAIVT